MRILFDQGVPVPLRRLLPAHDVETAAERGWSTLRNGQLLTSAEAAGFEVFLTTDRNLRYQQNLQGRRLAVVVLTRTDWARIRPGSERIAAVLGDAVAGSLVEVEIP